MAEKRIGLDVLIHSADPEFVLRNSPCNRLTNLGYELNATPKLKELAMRYNRMATYALQEWIHSPEGTQIAQRQIRSGPGVQWSNRAEPQQEYAPKNMDEGRSRGFLNMAECQDLLQSNFLRCALTDLRTSAPHCSRIAEGHCYSVLKTGGFGRWSI